MAKKKKLYSPVSNSGKSTLQSLKDPKFQYKCFVRLENYDITKFSDRSCLSTEPTDLENTVSEKKLKVLQSKSINHNIHNVDVESEKKIRLEDSNFRERPLFIDQKNTIKAKSVRKPRTLNDNCNHHNKMNCENVGDIVEQDKNNMKKFKVPVYCNQNVMHQKAAIEQGHMKGKKEVSVLVAGKSLRSRKEVNYKDRSSIDTPNASQNISSVESKRIPVYRKKIMNSPKSRKRKADLYDFVPEPEEDKDSDVSFRINIPAKKKRMNPQVQFDNPKIPKKLNHKKRQNVKVTVYDNKINNMMNKLSEKLRKKHINNRDLQMNETNTVLIDGNNVMLPDTVFNSTMLPQSQGIILLNDSIIPKSRLENHFPNIDIMATKEIRKNLSIPCSENSSLNTKQNISFDSSPFDCPDEGSIRSFDDNLDNLFGFADEVEQNKDDGKFSNKITVLQDVIVNKASPSNYCMSTPKLPQQKKSWRFDTRTLNRNPHFLSVKKNSLPALNQDLILDHTYDERIDGINKLVLVPTNKKAAQQQSILNYIEASREYPDNHNQSQSLYDISELSPLKSNTADKENSWERKKTNSNSRPKRNILGMINEDNLKNRSPIRNKEELVGQKSNTIDENGKEQDEPSNFGFDVSSEIVEENERRPKPFRVEFTYKKSNKTKKLPEIMTKPVRDSEIKRLIEEDPGFEEVVDKDGLDCGELGLFEDFEESLAHPKNNKFPRKKMAFQDTDKKKAPKEKLSKEAQKWIKQFNEMCCEVENEELEIE